MKVSDGGETPRHGYARVHVTLLDENDHSPKWAADILDVQVLEDAAAGTRVTRLVATDQDSGNNGTIRYNIISGNLTSI